MDLDQQIQELIGSAPDDGTSAALVRAIAPALKLMAERLQHTQYYVLQTLDRGWVMVTLSHRTQPLVEKKVVYAYPTLADARAGAYNTNDPQIVALPIPVTHILFQMLAMKTVDSMVFLETPGNLKTGTEITRTNFQESIKKAYQSTQQKPDIPTDIA